MRVSSLAPMFFAAVALVALCCVAALSQQPFVTDDADVTAAGKFHLQVANEIDRLQPSSFPNTYQNGTRFTLAYGVAKNIELSINAQVLGLFGASGTPSVVGVGDTALQVKYNFRGETDTSRLPAFTVIAFVQFPTGDARRSLGSGITGYGFNTIAQKTLKKANVVRVNVGYLFAGNTLVGNLGISTVRGHVMTAGTSFVRRINKNLQLGAELTGAVTTNFQLSKGQLQTQFGGNYQLNKKTTFDFGLIFGRYAASPRYGLLLGFSHDF